MEEDRIGFGTGNNSFQDIKLNKSKANQRSEKYIAEAKSLLISLERERDRLKAEIAAEKKHAQKAKAVGTIVGGVATALVPPLRIARLVNGAAAGFATGNIAVQAEEAYDALSQYSQTLMTLRNKLADVEKDIQDVKRKIR